MILPNMASLVHHAADGQNGKGIDFASLSRRSLTRIDR